MKALSDKSPDLDLAVFGELWDNNAREYIRLKYGNETESDAMKALEKFDADMRQNEVGQNFWTFYHKN